MKNILITLLLCMAITAYTQEEDIVKTDVQNGVPVAPAPVALTFGYASYDTLLIACPGYEAAKAEIDTLRARYDAEAQAIEDEFNEKYEEFLAGMNTFPQSILEKRQVELQEYLERNIAFREESKRLLAEAEVAAFAPLHEKVQEALKAIGQKHDLLFIINTDTKATPFINESLGVDVTEEVIALF